MKEAEKYLRSVDYIGHTITQLTSKREALEQSLLPSGIRYDKDKVQTSPTDQMSEICTQIADIDNEIKSLCISKAKRINEVYDTLQLLEDTRYSSILFRYYVSHERMEKISEDISHDLSWTYRLRRKGLMALNDLLRNQQSQK